MKGLLFTYLMTGGGAVASLINPFAGLLVYVCFAILKPEFLWPWSVPQGNYSRIVAIALLIGWFLHGFGRWDLGRAKAVIWAFLGYFAWILLSAAQAPDQGMAWEFAEKYAKILLPVLVGITTIESTRQLKLLAWVILLSHAYPAFEMNLRYFGGYNQLKEEGFGSMDNNCYAISLVAAMSLAAFLVLYSERWWQKAIAAASAAFMLHAILFSYSRGGMLGLIAMGLAAFVIMPKGPREYAAAVIVVLLALRLAGPSVRERFQTSFAKEEERDASAESRLILWTACFDTMMRHPIFGVGPDHMPLEIVNYGFKKGKESHTLWLQLGAELGLPGMIMIMLYYFICGVRLVPIARANSPPDPWLAYLARMVIAALCGFALSAQFVSVEFLEAPYYIALIGGGVLKLASRPDHMIADAECSPDIAFVG
jgi:probable O-glycosylation ligase (exosortase A-associated)